MSDIQALAFPKDKFNKKAESNAMSLSARIKYLMKLDIDNKLKILTNGN